MERETGIRLSQNRISEVLQDEGYVYRRPKKDLRHRQDETLRAQVREALEEVKKRTRRTFQAPLYGRKWIQFELSADAVLDGNCSSCVIQWM